jgi:hypothetical protein
MKQTLLKQQRRHEQLSMLPKFKPLNQYEVHIINRWTDTHLLHDIIHIAQNTTHFTVDTDSDMWTNKPALIQIELIRDVTSIVILVEVCHLPSHRQSLMFWLIRSLLKFILQPNKVIYAWGDGMDELLQFVDSGLFTSEQLEQLHMIHVQDEFKQWHQEQYGNTARVGDKWGLKAAISDQFNELLDKRETLNRWSRGLDRSSTDRDYDKIQRMIHYAANDCLAVTKLPKTINSNVATVHDNATLNP